jgi:hypothetical protein
MISTRVIALLVALVAIAVGVGFLIGFPSEVAAGTAIASAAALSLITVRDLAARARLGAQPVRRVAGSPPLEQLRQVDEILTAAQVSEFRVDRELRPLFRSIAAMRLARRGVDLDRHREEARTILGEELWELVRAERPRASDRFAGGISSAEQRGLIERLERI